jgi:hypothetical protein
VLPPAAEDVVPPSVPTAPTVESTLPAPPNPVCPPALDAASALPTVETPVAPPFAPASAAGPSPQAQNKKQSDATQRQPMRVVAVPVWLFSRIWLYLRCCFTKSG